MRKRLITVATAAVLLAFAAVSDAKPLKVSIDCSDYVHITEGSNYTYHLYQTFTPTFSNLKSISLAVWGGYSPSADPPTDDVTMGLQVFSGNPIDGLTPLALGYAETVVLAGAWYADAVSGYTVTFTFTDAISVTPGVTYTFEIKQIDYLDDYFSACDASSEYVDGTAYLNQADFQKDLAFKMTGSGRGSAPK